MAYFIEPHIIEEIQERSNIVDVVSQYVELKKTGSSYKGLCPFHSEKTPSFSVSEDKKIFKCFGCGAGGSVINFLMRIEGYSFPEAAKVLADMYGVEIESSNKFYDHKREEEKKIYEINRLIAYHFLGNLYKSERAKQYFFNRGLSEKTLRSFGMGYASNSWDDVKKLLESKNIDLDLGVKAGVLRKSESGVYYDYYRDRVIFPIIDERSRVLGFGGRVVNNEDTPKYINTLDTPVFHKGSTLYNINQLPRNKKVEKIILVEGYMDVVGLVSQEIYNVVATLGTAITSAQANLLKRYTDNVIVAYDGDQAGINAAKTAVSVLSSSNVSVNVVELPEGLDPEEYIKKHGIYRFKLLIDKAPDGISFLINRFKEDNETTSIQGKTDLIRYIGSLIKNIKSPIEKDLYIQQISENYNISQRAIRDELFGANNNESIKLSSPNDYNVTYSNNDKALIELYKIMINNSEISDYILEKISSIDIEDFKLREIFFFLKDLRSNDQLIEKEAVLNYLTENYIIDENLNKELQSDNGNLREYDIYEYIDELIHKVKQLDKKTERIEILNRIKDLEKLEATPETVTEIDNLLNKLINK